ncbi:hypothetical protein [Sporofaciens musculi]|nr:hypothetical protein [Sporofaciens musculi]
MQPERENNSLRRIFSSSKEAGKSLLPPCRKKDIYSPACPSLGPPG